MPLRHWLLLWVAGLAGPTLGATPSILNAQTHADDHIIPAIVAALGSNPLNVDYDPTGSVSTIVAQSVNASGSFRAVGTTTPVVNHAPYAVINASLCCYNPTYDQSYYPALLSQNTTYTTPIGPMPLPARTPPSSTMSAVTSPNSGDGASGWGTEFGLSVSYLGLDTSEDSWTSAEMAGFFAALLHNHPTWNLFELHAAFRQTAGNWATGYNNTTFGYGFVNWPAANAVTGTGAGVMWLQPPGFQIQNKGYYAIVTLYPFRQTRRANELIYSVSAAYTWPIKNEYSAADIAASGATLLYTSNGTDIMPQFVFAPVASGTVTLVPFTSDGSGGFSRVESFGTQSITLVVGTSCAQP